MIRIYLFLLFSFLFLTNTSAQKDYQILFSTGTITPTENIRDFAKNATINASENYDGYYYRMIQFYDIPTNEDHQLIKQNRIQLLDYLPHLAYIAAIPVDLNPQKLIDLNIRAVMDITSEYKIAPNLRQQPFGEWALRKDRVAVKIKYYKNIAQKDLLLHLEADGIRVEAANGHNNFLRATIDQDKIEEVAALSYIAYLELIPEPGKADDDLGRSLHRANLLDASYAGGRSYTGDGVGVLVRDDGDIGPHIDFQGRLRQEFVTDFGGGTHGDGVGGILAGAGNFNPQNRGMAAGAEVHVLDYEADHLDETMDLFFDEGVIVTNSSYSNGCGAGYTTITQTVDQQIFDNPTLIHVFSAGNSNNNDCGYGAGDQWGNITGGHKQGKNVIATANLLADATLANSSSRGPATDGRIKPDISANGADHVSTSPNNSYQSFGGTSGAAPGIAGVIAQLHQAHRELNGGVTAESALLKAMVLNSANDLGNIGPDFKFGWGHVNAYRAITTLEDGRYFAATVDPSATQTHTLDIPANVLQAKIMVYWKDQEASTSAIKSLVNNLDARVLDPMGNVNLPWVLDPTPNPALLDSPATTGIDDLNNMEQIAINNPAAGTYTIEVEGTELPFGAHEYYVVYEFLMDDVKLIYPVGGEGFVPGETERIHWDAHGINDDFMLSYSIDGGNTWSNISNSGAATRMFDWTVPNDFSGQALVRVQRGGTESISEANFSISPEPTGLEVLTACPDYIELGWNELPNATGYKIFQLGEKYMEEEGTTSDLTFQIPINPSNLNDERYFAITALGVNGLETRRTIALYYSGGFFNCTLQNDVDLVEIQSIDAGNVFSCDDVFMESVTVDITNPGLTTATNFQAGYQIDNSPQVIEMVNVTLEPGESTEYTFTEPFSISSSGTHNLTSWISVAGDQFLPNDTSSIDFNLTILSSAVAQLDIVETFETGNFPPTDWISINEDNIIGWESFNVTQADGSNGEAARINNYNYAAAANVPIEDYLFTYPIDLTNAVNPIFSFDLAYTYYQAGGQFFQDGFRVELSDNCGASFDHILYEAFGDDLKTVPEQSGVFVPQASSDWRNELFDLTPYIGNNVMVRFVNISGYGNNLYLDNINFTSLVAPQANFTTDITTICQGEMITFLDNSSGGGLTYDWDFGTGSSPSTSTNGGNQQVTFDTPGMVSVSLTVSNSVGTNNSVMTYNVEPLPVPEYTSVATDDVVAFTNTSTNGETYLWNFGDGNTSTEENPTHTYTTSGTYNVSLTVTNNCGDVTYSESINVVFTSIFDPEASFELSILPNPNKGIFEMVIESNETDELNWNLYNLQGQSIKEGNLSVSPGISRQRINGNNLPAGIYYLKLQNELGFQTMKIVVQ